MNFVKSFIMTAKAFSLSKAAMFPGHGCGVSCVSSLLAKHAFIIGGKLG